MCIVAVVSLPTSMAWHQKRCDDQYRIRGYSCPLAAAVPGHPEVCRLTETLLTELVDLPLQEQCDASETAQSRFVVQNTALQKR